MGSKCKWRILFLLGEGGGEEREEEGKRETPHPTLSKAAAGGLEIDSVRYQGYSGWRASLPEADRTMLLPDKGLTRASRAKLSCHHEFTQLLINVIAQLLF